MGLRDKRGKEGRALWSEQSEGVTWEGVGKILVGKVKDTGHRPVYTNLIILRIME